LTRVKENKQKLPILITSSDKCVGRKFPGGVEGQRKKQDRKIAPLKGN